MLRTVLEILRDLIVVAGAITCIWVWNGTTSKQVSTVAANYQSRAWLFVAAALLLYFAYEAIRTRLQLKGAIEANQRGAVGTKSNGASQLKILSAFYGIGDYNDRDVTGVLQDAIGDGLFIKVDNNLIPGMSDPAPNRNKRVVVKYSFAGRIMPEFVCQEYQNLVLPLDVEHLERTAAEYSAGKHLAEAERDTALAEIEQLEAEIRKINSAAEWPYFTVQQANVARENLVPGLPNGEVLNVVITNDSASSLQIVTPVWKSDSVKMCQGFAPSLALERLEGGGWKQNSYEFARLQGSLHVAPGMTFKCAVPLVTPRGDGLVRRLQQKTTGTLIFPANIDNSVKVLSVNL